MVSVNLSRKIRRHFYCDEFNKLGQGRGKLYYTMPGPEKTDPPTAVLWFQLPEGLRETILQNWRGEDDKVLNQ